MKRYTHLRFTLLSLAIAAAAATSGCASASAGSGGASNTATNRSTGNQRIAIEERWQFGSPSGTFRLIPLSPGPLKPDSGTFTFPEASGQVMIRGGQSVTTYKGVDTLDGRHGTLTVPNLSNSSAAGAKYESGASTWSVGKATGVYARLHGGGHGSIVATPDGLVLTRYEGYVRVG